MLATSQMLAPLSTILSLLPYVAGLPYYGNVGNSEANPYVLQRRSTFNTSSAHINDATGYKGAAACVSFCSQGAFL